MWPYSSDQITNIMNIHLTVSPVLFFPSRMLRLIRCVSRSTGKPCWCWRRAPTGTSRAEQETTASEKPWCTHLWDKTGSSSFRRFTWVLAGCHWSLQHSWCFVYRSFCQDLINGLLFDNQKRTGLQPCLVEWLVISPEMLQQTKVN